MLNASADEAYAIYGYEREIVPTPEHVQDRVHPEDQARVFSQMQEAMRDNADWVSEFRLLMPSGAIKYAHVTASVVRNRLEQREYIGAIMDVTDRRRAEQAEALALAHDRIERALREAEAANKAKDEFLANVSHEIRTPMNAVLGMTELVLDTEVTPEQRQWLRAVKTSADNLLGIIDDLLDFSKIQAGMLELDLTEFDLRGELDETLRGLAIRAARKGLALTHRVGADVPDRLVGDAGRLRQVLLNLVGNAIKFTAAGEVGLEVSVDEAVQDAIGLSFLVRDTGIGIPLEKQAIIFQAFAQQDTSTTRTYGGTGLGLTIAARLAALMGGRITVTSEPGCGSTFIFSAGFGKKTTQVALPVELGAPLTYSAPSLRVLVAEDHEVNSLLLRELLLRRGHRPTVAKDGIEALRLLDTGAYDLLMLDLHMPGLDGFQVIARIRERERERASAQRLPVIALTARSRQVDRDRCLAAGMDEFLAKPLQANALWAAIERVTEWEAAPTLVDARALLGACDGNPGVFGRIRNALLTAVPAELRAAEICLQADDLPALREAAHRLHGMLSAASSTVGDAASELEDEAANGAAETARSVLARLSALASQLLAELRRMGVGDLERLDQARNAID